MGKNLPVKEAWETQVPCLDQEDLLEKGMATHPSILAWRFPWTEEPGASMGLQRVRHNGATSTFAFSRLHVKSYAQLSMRSNKTDGP